MSPIADKVQVRHERRYDTDGEFTVYLVRSPGNVCQDEF